MANVDVSAFMSLKSKAKKKRLVTKDKRDQAMPSRTFAHGACMNSLKGSPSPRKRANPLGRVAARVTAKENCEREKLLMARFEKVLGASTKKGPKPPAQVIGYEGVETSPKPRARAEVLSPAQLKKEKLAKAESHRKWIEQLDALDSALSSSQSGQSLVGNVLTKLDSAEQAAMMRKRREEEKEALERIMKERKAKLTNSKKVKEKAMYDRLSTEGATLVRKKEKASKEHHAHYHKPELNIRSKHLTKDRKFEDIMAWGAERDEKLGRARHAKDKAANEGFGELPLVSHIKTERLKIKSKSSREVPQHTTNPRRGWTPPNTGHTPRRASPRTTLSPKSSPRPKTPGAKKPAPEPANPFPVHNGERRPVTHGFNTAPRVLSTAAFTKGRLKNHRAE